MLIGSIIAFFIIAVALGLYTRILAYPAFPSFLLIYFGTEMLKHRPYSSILTLIIAICGIAAMIYIAEKKGRYRREKDE